MSIGLSSSILHNLTALQAATQLSTNQSNLSKAIQRLSTGLRINTPADDVAGNAISNRLQNNLNILEQGTLNAQDGVSVIQVAQGGLTQIMNLLQRMNTLAAEAASAAKSETDRADIQTEINQILAEVNQIVTETTFGSQVLLDGSIAGVQAAVNATINVASNSFIGASANSLVAGVSISPAALATLGCVLDEVFQVAIAPSTSSTDVVIDVFSSLQGSGNAVIASKDISLAGAGTPQALTFSTFGNAVVTVTLNFSGLQSTDINNIVGLRSFIASQAFQPGVTVDKSLVIQVGGDVGQVLEVNSPSVQTSNIFSGQSVSVLTTMEAQGTLNQVEHAISIVSSDESVLGALQNRFNALVANNQILDENQTASLSRITDANVAQETTDLTKQQILVQTATAMLAQANLVPQSILRLFQ